MASFDEKIKNIDTDLNKLCNDSKRWGLYEPCYDLQVELDNLIKRKVAEKVGAIYKEIESMAERGKTFTGEKFITLEHVKYVLENQIFKDKNDERIKNA